MENEKRLLACCRAALGAETEEIPSLASLDGAAWDALYRLAKHHDLCHLVAEAVRRLSLDPPAEIAAKLEKQSMIALYRTEQVSYELASLTAALTEARVPHLPLKGSVLRTYYPAPELRLSCDIDLLVRPEDLARARRVLTEVLGYTDEGDGSHDVQTYAPSGLHVELHFDLIESGYLPEAAAILQNVWDHASAEPETPYTYVLSDEMFYFYHIAHMAKHFAETGGCGVRPFLDLYVLRRVEKCGEASERKRLLTLGGLSAFEEAATELSEIWMADGKPTSRAEAMSRFVLTGGTYGVTENRVAVARGRGKGRARYLLSRLFPSYRFMCFRYPVLRRVPILLPFCYLVRLASPLWNGRRRQLMREAKAASAISETELSGTSDLLLQLGLLRE